MTHRWTLARRSYPDNWEEISLLVRERALWVCEMPGCGARHKWFHPITGRIVYLQAAHLDHNPHNCSFENLAALCQRCHLSYDAHIHVLRRFESERRRHDETQDQLSLRPYPLASPLPRTVPLVLVAAHITRRSRRDAEATEMQKVRQKRLVD